MNQHEQMEKNLDGTIPREPTQPIDVAQPHPQQEKAMAVFEKIQKQRHFGMSVNIGQIAGSLLAAPEVTKFPEELFVQHFLPMFVGEIEETAELNYTTWIDKVAGGHEFPVDIVDADGKVLFRVPAIFNSSVLEQTRPGSIAMTHIERQYSRLKEFDANASQQFLSKTLSGMHIKDKPTQEVFDNMRIWNEILKRYGREDKIIKLIDDAGDQNRDKPLGSETEANSSDIGDYELDTD